MMKGRDVFRPSIARRLMVALLVASALVWASIYAIGRHSVYAPQTGSFDRELLALADAAARVVEQAGDEAVLRQGLAALAAKMAADERRQISPAGFLALRVRDADGRVLAEAGQVPLRWSVERQALQRGLQDAYDAAGRRYRVHLAQRGGIELLCVQSELSRQAAFDGVMLSREGLVQPLLIAFPLVLVPVWLAVFSGLGPLRRLSRELASRRPEDLSPLAVPPVYAELAPVVQELNRLLARLQRLLARERHFLADAAHELRTPLAVISAQVDNLDAGLTPPDRQAALRRLRGGLSRATRLVGQLLELARLDAEVEPEAHTVNLADLVRDTLAAQSAPALAKGMELSYVGPDDLLARNLGAAAETIVGNLVGNAVLHGREYGRVEVLLSGGGAVPVLLTVADDGPGIAPQDRTRVFERFQRGPEADSRSGSGLGLPIMAAAARRLGATVSLGPGLDGQGLGVQVQWPSGGCKAGDKLAQRACKGGHT